jgi:hypothetical protein
VLGQHGKPCLLVKISRQAGSQFSKLAHGPFRSSGTLRHTVERAMRTSAWLGGGVCLGCASPSTGSHRPAAPPKPVWPQRDRWACRQPGRNPTHQPSHAQDFKHSGRLVLRRDILCWSKHPKDFYVSNGPRQCAWNVQASRGCNDVLCDFRAKTNSLCYQRHRCDQSLGAALKNGLLKKLSTL